MWLETEDRNLINLDNVARVYIRGRKVVGSDYPWPTVYAQFNDAIREVDSVLFTSEFDPDQYGGRRGRKECDFYIEKLFSLIMQRAPEGKSISHEDIAPFVRQQRKYIEV